MDTRRNLLKRNRELSLKSVPLPAAYRNRRYGLYPPGGSGAGAVQSENQGKDVVLVSSGAIAQGKKAVHLTPEQLQEHPIAVKQACAAVGQARLMMTYQKILQNIIR